MSRRRNRRLPNTAEIAACVRCGSGNDFDATVCRDCAWPLALEAWRGSQHRIQRLSLDAGCINAKQRDVDLNVLERWVQEGLISLEVSDVFHSELENAWPIQVLKAQATPPHPPVWRLGVAGGCELGINTFLAGADIGEEAPLVLFPTAAPLTSSQAKDVEHLRSHVIAGADAFVTLNKRDFIRGGKHERLRRVKQERLRRCGIWVFTPPEIKELLASLYGWPV
jgi:hypothetical protein